MARRRTSHPIGWRVVTGAIIVLIAWLAIGGTGGQMVGKLSELQKNDNASFLPEDAESTQVALVARRFNETGALPLIIVAERSEGLTPQDLGEARRLAGTLPERRFALDGDRRLGDYLVAGQPPAAIPSQDGKALLLVLALDAAKVSQRVGESTPVVAIGDDMRTLVEQDLRARGLTAYVTGPAGFISDITAAFAGIDGLLLLVALGVVLVILLMVYRSPVLPFAVLLTAVFGLGAAGIVVYQVAKAGWITVSGQSQGILSILVVGAATDYALLLVSRYKEELHRHESTLTALKIAWRATLEPILASAATVILGLLALLLADLKGTSGLGPVAALGIIGAFLAAVTLLPAILIIGRRWVFWPMIPRVDQPQEGDVIARKLGWGRVAEAVGRRPRTVWLATLAGLLVAGAFLPTLKNDGISQSDVFLTKVDSVQGQEVLDRHFDGGSGSPLEIIAPQDRATDVLTVLRREEGLANPMIGNAPGAPPKVVDGNVLIQATLTASADAPEAVDTVARVRADLDAVSPDIMVGGRTAEALDTRTAADRDLLVVAPAITLVVFLVLCLLLRALVAPALLIVANLLSFAATMGISALVFNHLFTFAGGDPTTVLYGFVFLVALGVDYSIFLMTRAREEAFRQGHRRGVLTALMVTGGVITSAGVVLAATFGALAVLPLLFLAQIAFIVAFGVLLDTLVVRSLLVPALALEIGPKTWWPGRLAKTAGEDPAAAEGADQPPLAAATR
ncbi:MAG: MMPL family transporter [Austwickia sp.]|nr:MMPL family transporter [Austwickia sp.]MBK8436165.1 MMPL family transporter [Austwickia sp.]MBK9101846.1 MMPL family transporter [Austwickia sp.]